MRKISCLLATLFIGAAQASDHLDSAYIDLQPEWDIGDLFLWTGEQTGSPVFLMTFNPLTTHMNDTRAIKLDEKAVYQFKVDTDGDFRADLAYKFTVIGDQQEQGLVVRKSNGKSAMSDTSEDGGDTQTIATGKTSVAGGDVKVITGKNGELVFVGPRQDPFFFDFRTVESPAALDLRFALGADGLPSDGSAANTFGPTNMTVVAIEVPELKGKKFSAWATTSQGGKQVDRCGRASITAIFAVNTPPGRNPAKYPNKNPKPEAKPPLANVPKQIYNTRRPVDDVENYRDMFYDRLVQLQSNNDDAEKLAEFFLPDVLDYDPTSPMGYPNGRNLKEDAVYITLDMINPFLFYDKDTYQFPAENQQKLSANFPYAASPVLFPPKYEQAVKKINGQ